MNPTLSEKRMFVCNLGSKLENFKYSFLDLGEILYPDEIVRIIRSNFTYKTYNNDRYVFSKKTKQKIKNPKRKKQGTSLCFNNSIEFVLFPYSNINKKYYKLKLFPSTGVFHISGVIESDFSDGFYIGKLFVEYLIKKLNKNNIYIKSYEPLMINYAFNICNIYGKTFEYEKFEKILQQKYKIYMLSKSEKKILTISDYDNCYSAKLIIYGSNKMNILGVKNENFADRLYNDIKHIIENDNIFEKKILTDLDMINYDKIFKIILKIFNLLFLR